MKVLMLGWEYPPRFTGGLGVATRGLARGLASIGVDLTLLLPRAPEGAGAPGLRVQSASDPAGGEAAFETPAYPGSAGASRGRNPIGGGYGPNLHHDVARFAQAVGRIAASEDYDVVHAHDWMTFPAAARASEICGAPMVVQVHSTEFDRTDGPGDPRVRRLESEGLARAARVIAVSRFTAGVIERRYGIPAAKIRVVHNAIDSEPEPAPLGFEKHEPMILFAGRLTYQKGPDHLVEAAALVLERRPDARFVFAGTGDMLPRLLERVAHLGLGERILFTGFLEPPMLDRLYLRADIYVLPSVSEPFGLTVLEALRHGVPVIVTRHAGAAEIVRNAIKVDFWDIEGMAARILALLEHEPLRRELAVRGREEVRRFSWAQAARRCAAVYREVAR